jgi:uncharacterized membrane protein
MAKWLVPTLGYAMALGAAGVTSKLALRSVTWQGLILLITPVYLATTLGLVAIGGIEIGGGINLFWGIVSSALMVSALILLYVALGAGEAAKVASVGAAYPAITLLGSALFLGEAFTLGRTMGVALVIGGVVVLTTVK